MPEPLVLAVNPGSGSTKLALFLGEAARREERLEHPELASRPASRALDELPVRLAAVRAFLAAAGIGKGELAAVVGRGGLLPPLAAGAWEVDDAMLADLARAERGEHASTWVLRSPVPSPTSTAAGPSWWTRFRWTSSTRWPASPASPGSSGAA